MKLVILDRDGTLNHDSDGHIKSPEEWKALPGALEAVGRLNHAGYHVIVATNQSGLGRGLLDVASLNAIHKRMMKQLAAVGGRIDAIFYQIFDYPMKQISINPTQHIRLPKLRFKNNTLPRSIFHVFDSLKHHLIQIQCFQHRF